MKRSAKLVRSSARVSISLGGRLERQRWVPEFQPPDSERGFREMGEGRDWRKVAWKFASHFRVAVVR